MYQLDLTVICRGCGRQSFIREIELDLLDSFKNMLKSLKKEGVFDGIKDICDRCKGEENDS